MIRRIILFNVIFLVYSYMIADENCLDNSKHVNLCNGYDYKKYLPVKCYCPCKRYPILFKRGKCNKCGHYRALGNY